MTSEPETLFCANHPNTPTGLRCNRCEKPICMKCAVLTPTGYRCKECISGQQKKFETAQWYDYVLALVVAGGLGLLGSILITFLPLAFLTFFIAPIIGTVIGEAVRLVTRKRRSRTLFFLVIGAIALGGLPILILEFIGMGLFTFYAGISGLAGGLISVIWQGVYIFLAASSAYYRLSGFTIRF
jgi:hypothetical protein